MRPHAKRWISRLGVIVPIACLAPVLPVHAGAQDRPSEQVVPPAPGPRLGSVDTGLRVWKQPALWPDSTETQGTQLHQTTVDARQELRSDFSGRGALIGAAIGCAVGAVAYYDPDDEEPASHRLAKTAFLCGVLALPGAYFGAIFIP